MVIVPRQLCFLSTIIPVFIVIIIITHTISICSHLTTITNVRLNPLIFSIFLSRPATAFFFTQLLLILVPTLQWITNCFIDLLKLFFMPRTEFLFFVPVCLAFFVVVSTSLYYTIFNKECKRHFPTIPYIFLAIVLFNAYSAYHVFHPSFNKITITSYHCKL